jgi:hypothetical protein
VLKNIRLGTPNRICDGYVSGVQNKVVAIPRLEHMVHHRLPGRENVARNVGCSTLYSIKMLNGIRADDLNFYELGCGPPCGLLPSIPALRDGFTQSATTEIPSFRFASAKALATM